MAAGRPASLVATCDQWARATHDRTAIAGTTGDLMLSWDPPEFVAPEAGAPCTARGIVVDRLCRLYRLGRDHVERRALGPTEGGISSVTDAAPARIVDTASGGTGSLDETPTGRFEPSDATSPATGADFRGLTIDADDHLFVADADARAITVHDLWSRRLLRSIPIARPAHPSRFPMGLCTAGPDSRIVYAAVRRPSGLLRLGALRGPVEVELPTDGVPTDAEPARVAVLHDGRPIVLFQRADGRSWLTGERAPAIDVGHSSDLIVDASGAVVLAPCAADDSSGPTLLRRLTLVGGTWQDEHPLDVAGYDGNGIALTSDDRVVYLADVAGGATVRLAAAAPVQYRTEGRCTTYRLDSGRPMNRWGRVLIDACVPDGTDCFVSAVSSDDEFETAIPHVDASPTACFPAATESPALPPARLTVPDADVDGALHRRPRATTAYWTHSGAVATYEAPVFADPGRFLWVTIRLRGNGRRTPRVRELRVEHARHGLLKRLPAVFASDPERADFLDRYLAPLDGMLHDLDLHARCRDLLVDPHGTPAEALEWLASFVGLVLDDRWHEAARRQLVAEIVELYRRRGTLASITRYLELFLQGPLAVELARHPERPGISPVIIEHFRFRGVGVPLLGDDPALSSRSVLGAGFRVGGSVGDAEGRSIGPGADPTSPFAQGAHRFTVLVPRSLDAEEEAAIRHVLDVERPAHTDYVLCTVEAGLRAGRGAHIGVSAIVGPTGSFETTIAGETVLGRRSLLGRPTAGAAVEADRLDLNAWVR